MLQPVDWGPGNVACPPSVFRRYTEHNLKRGLEEIERGEVRNDPLYIVCSGPSLLDTWEILKDRPGEIWALNAAFDWLCEKGVRPDYGVCLACEEPILRYFQYCSTGDKFYFASQTHPVLMDRALSRGCSVKLFHVAAPEGWDMPVPKDNLIFGAGTVGTRAIDLAWVLGFRDVHILGMDACLSPDGRIAVETPMYDDRRDALRTFTTNGRAFVAMPSHARQVEDFASVLRPLTGMTVTMYGDGMLQWSLNQPQENAA